jgi:diaminohydroxyphosphoribosylaminopyrimidine deaminase / 5-amino-6-(5-phosphoribosylamino)uracil reductase
MVELSDLLQKLGNEGVLSILCEGGPTLAGSLLAKKYVNELIWLIAPTVLAGEADIEVIRHRALDVSLHIETLKRLGEDILLTARVIG